MTAVNVNGVALSIESFGDDDAPLVLLAGGATEADVESLVASACDRYRVQQERIAQGDWSGEDLSEFLRAFAGDRDMSLAALRQAVTGICVEQ